MKLSAILVSVLPLLWLISHQIYYILLVQVFSGIAWSAFTLSNTNFIYDCAIPGNRTRSIAVYNAVNGGTMCVGSLVGGYLAISLPVFLGYRTLALFLVSALLRSTVAFVLGGRVSEVRDVRPSTNLLDLIAGQENTERPNARLIK